MTGGAVVGGAAAAAVPAPAPEYIFVLASLSEAATQSGSPPIHPRPASPLAVPMVGAGGSASGVTFEPQPARSTMTETDVIATRDVNM